MPEPLGEDSVLVRVAYSGICNSDLHRGFGGGAYLYPLVMGHELSAVVEKSFAGSRYRPGDRVVVYPLLPCRRCIPCQTGDYAQCMDYDYFGSRRHGGFAEYLYVPEFNLLPIPQAVDLAHAALTEPCAVALHGVKRMGIRPGESGCVFGGGPIGNMVAQWLALRGCRPVFVVDVDPKKLSLAEEMGFVPIDATAGDPVAEILSRTAGNGADRVVEAVGLPKTFLQATQAAARGGQVVFLGNIRGEFRIGEKDFSSILRRELTILGTWNSKVVPEGHNEWTTVLEFMGGGLRIAELISHTPELEEGPEIFRGIIEGSLGSYRKIVFRIRP
jgi:L-iditol 2-dehydrogenase/galactitol-1-phosphate 5-dehydrogenase